MGISTTICSLGCLTLTKSNPSDNGNMGKSQNSLCPQIEVDTLICSRASFFLEQNNKYKEAKMVNPPGTHSAGVACETRTCPCAYSIHNQHAFVETTAFSAEDHFFPALPDAGGPYCVEQSGPLFSPNTKPYRYEIPYDGSSRKLEYLSSLEPCFHRDGYSVYIEYANWAIKRGVRKNLPHEIKKGEQMKNNLLKAAWEHYRMRAEKMRGRREEAKGDGLWKEGGTQEAWRVEREMGQLWREMELIDWQGEAGELGHPARWVLDAWMGEL
ncbi:hypothetical protein EV426DRAFT_702082 [Tirmania nivea]|nr:hypothetical protein EV426DRAFT_702082 [Tirmania nivea]